MGLKSYRREIVRKIRAGAKKKALKMVNAIRNEAITGMAGPKSGREYPVPGTKRTYIASAPGEYPAIRTGQLRSQIKLAIQTTLTGVYGAVGTNIKHGIILEGETEVDQAAGIRPWLSKAVRDAEPELKRILDEPFI